jgi:hypothetical protein
MNQLKDFSANYCHYCLVENIPQMSFTIVSDDQLYLALHFLIPLYPVLQDINLLLSK